MIQFRSFRARLLTLILALAGLSQLASLLIVAGVNKKYALEDIDQELTQAREEFKRNVAEKNETLAQLTVALSRDEGMRKAIAADAEDAATLRSALNNLRGRVKANLAALISDDGILRAESRVGASAASVYRPIFMDADLSDRGEATGYGVIDGQLYSLSVVGFRAPDIIAWVVVGFQIDKEFLESLSGGSDVELTLSHAGRTLASTMTPTQDEMIDRRLELPIAGAPPAEILLQYSLTKKLEPATRLEGILGIVGGSTMVVAGILALGIARSVSRPVRRLAKHTELIAKGDYETRLELDQLDELGRLATSLNAMSTGLAERDRVRDLLDKNVSPEVAAQLMRDGAALGGEEREATILFADLRGFTGFSERKQPREIVALLNRYLDRMSAEIERHGGVIDKYIGDEIMALFSAPVAQPDAADRALSAALAMTSALEALNRELGTENREPLAIGVGINTARVVAGNIGSKRRLNYSVIGDGVNVAARLQTLTRAAEHRATIIVSEATKAASTKTFNFRPLGSVAVKGRKEPIQVFALEL